MWPKGTLITDGVVAGYVYGTCQIQRNNFYQIIIARGPMRAIRTLSLISENDATRVPTVIDCRPPGSRPLPDNTLYQIVDGTLDLIDQTLADITSRFTPGQQVRLKPDIHISQAPRNHQQRLFDDEPPPSNEPMYVCDIKRIDLIQPYNRILTIGADGYNRLEGGEHHFEPA